jgi:peptidoglycan endopeptidase LytE
MPWPTRSCLLTLALTAASLAAPTHTVQKGETFYQIAKEHGLTPDALGKANPSVNPQRLHPGDLLRLPTSVPTPSPSPAKSAPTTPTQPAWVKIQKGDTLSKISRQTGVSIEDLRRWNQLSDNSLSIGKILRLSPPAPP